MFYGGSKHEICYNLKEPPIYSNDNRVAIEYWNFLASDRPSGQGPTTIRTDTITDFCRTSSLSYEMFIKIKIIESLYYNRAVKQFSERMEAPKKGKEGK